MKLQHNCPIIVTFFNEHLVGIIGISIENKLVTINHLAILNVYRDNGIAKSLVYYVAKSFQSQKIIAETDDEAIGFYRALKFNCESFDWQYGRRYKCELDV